ncbi:MAG: hypothetical protein GXO25_00405 [Euryarchaeota archaeon]|nr:hypothetical protein [Euryarchaeota archaeon]
MLTGAVVAPHGDEILTPESEDMKALHDAMAFAGSVLGDTDLYILISPHNIRIDTHIGVILTENLSGSWEWRGIKIEKHLRSERGVAERIYNTALKEHVPVVGINFGALEGPLSEMILDWGSLIPLHFFPDKSTVLLTPARGITRAQLVKFGEILADIAETEQRKIALIVSADQAHAHSPRGPYGYSPMAKEFDSQVLSALRAGELSPLLEMPQTLIDGALPDSYWQLLILHGVMKKVPMQVLRVEYGVAEYFGMAVAVMQRNE